MHGCIRLKQDGSDDVRYGVEANFSFAKMCSSSEIQLLCCFNFLHEGENLKCIMN